MSEPFDAKAIFAKVKEDNRRWNDCPAHRFDPPAVRKLGEKMKCLNCGVAKSGPDILYYVQGYAAAGGDPNDVWPGWGVPRST